MIGPRVTAVRSRIAGAAADAREAGHPAAGWSATAAGQPTTGPRLTAVRSGLAGPAADRHEAGRPATRWAPMPAGFPANRHPAALGDRTRRQPTAAGRSPGGPALRSGR
ncbi:hypothetical protein [Amycolatopsis kentuckyensis]|uniref:hypothetical protein n=1 Tax=Amycolatopsis kentuckyensis TaxID=218823 RepID=UPI00117766DB|nr:hypothetical protein [Amycolatopsis kentuckyensis]